MENPVGEKKMGCIQMITISCINIFATTLISVVLARNFNSVWKIDASRSLFSNEREILSFLLSSNCFYFHNSHSRF